MDLRQNLIELLSELISIDSSNSWLIPRGAGERNVQMYIKNYLEALGIEATFEKIDEDHQNLVATLKGTGGGKPITLYAHADTVGYELWPEEALKAKIKDDCIIGLGSADDKGHCAAILLVLKEISNKKIKLSGDINVCFIADEEGQSCGTFDYVTKHEKEAALILESAPINHINVTHQGFGWLKIKVKGHAAHGSDPGMGVDAITHMAEVIVRMEKNKRENFAKNPHPLNGETVYHTGVIKGGTDYATYPDYCELGIEIGTQPGETIENRIKEIEDIFAEIKKEDQRFEGSVEVVIARNPFESSGADELLGILSDEVKKITGKEAIAVGENSWGDAQIFQDAGFPTLGIGADGGNLHAPDEWVSIPELLKLVEVLVKSIQRYCA